MQHVFVETNWVFAIAAPAHHKRADAVELFKRAQRGEVILHLPAPCLTEARQPILTKCQPRYEADAIRQFLLWARPTGSVSPEQEQATRAVLDRFEQQVRAELREVDDIIRKLRGQSGVEVFPLNERMLTKAVDLAESELSLRPFDQAILAAVLGRAEELREASITDLWLCETDADLQPWDKHGEAKHPLVHFYNEAAVWVYGDFNLDWPERPPDWPE
jgi:hypothetical protein